jgi:hypothetical protein
MSGQKMEAWAARTAGHLVDGALGAVETVPPEDQLALLRAIAQRALWHMPNAASEARQLARVMAVENLKRPHPRDDPPARD